MVKVAVILPSRGLIFSETAEEILNNLKSIPHKIFFSHKQPIPQCFEEPTKKALGDKSITHIWLVEDDMVLPPNALKKMLEMDANVVACDYPITKTGRGSVFYDAGGNVVFCGTGCLLIKRDVFDNLKLPYFTDKVRWTVLNYGEAVKLVASRNTKGEGYGLHDITFCLRLWQQGLKIRIASIKLGQRKLVALGKAGTNNGAHNIEVWKKIQKNARLKEIQSQPIALVAKSKLTTVRTPTGDVNATLDHAKKLVKEGLATYLPKSYTIIDTNGIRL